MKNLSVLFEGIFDTETAVNKLDFFECSKDILDYFSIKPNDKFMRSIHEYNSRLGMVYLQQNVGDVLTSCDELSEASDKLLNRSGENSDAVSQIKKYTKAFVYDLKKIINNDYSIEDLIEESEFFNAVIDCLEQIKQLDKKHLIKSVEKFVLPRIFSQIGTAWITIQCKDDIKNELLEIFSKITPPKGFDVDAGPSRKFIELGITKK